jgi:geranylgeranyl diphosphate synthase type II
LTLAPLHVYTFAQLLLSCLSDIAGTPEQEVRMDIQKRIETALEAALAQVESRESPPRLAAAMRYAVFPGGARLRPRLCLAVAAACGEDDPLAADAAAAAIELLHCASLVHDDLPCFDDAPLRRGQPALHLAFDERLAVLTGDALIVLAFQVLARGALRHPLRLAALTLTVARAVGMPHGIAAGQAWECETGVDLTQYQQAKTGALFAAATAAGATAAGEDAEPWRPLGSYVGEAYQVADDIRDAFGDQEELGKPVGQDATHGRPNAVHQLGLEAAIRRLGNLVDQAVTSIPDVPGAPLLRDLIRHEAQSFLPRRLQRRAA